jgi:hypothetical protein
MMGHQESKAEGDGGYWILGFCSKTATRLDYQVRIYNWGLVLV